MMAAIAAARREVLIMTPYFLPPAELIAALQGAALRGVRTVVLLPKRNNLPYVGWAAEHQLAQLLERGVRIRFQTGPFCHSKLFVVDGAYAMIGRSEEHTSELQSLMRISYAVLCLKQKKNIDGTIHQVT